MHTFGLCITQKECFKPTDFIVSKVPLIMTYSIILYNTKEGKILPVKLKPINFCKIHPNFRDVKI